ncbi:MAG: hypothetical protein E4H14_03830 [Candidatus Thorarchaeota archaeon]|nr:MAG: hypothetical protein E4H14_03830 [Candidatus Thorarchaeota archaeon]
MPATPTSSKNGSIFEGSPSSKKVLADIADPKTPVSLGELVSELIALTPMVYLTDSDGDSIPDVVERVIGTNIYDNDTDGDLLSDSFEVYNDLDPLSPDSNDDGFVDTFDVDVIGDNVCDGVHIDSDGDGIKDGWDFDNDSDGVNDIVDLSPYASSQTSSSFQFDIATTGRPVYIEFQIIPENPEHLKLLSQTWNWPNDNEGTMRDLDGSTDDVIVTPLLNITTSNLPDLASLQEQGIIETSTGMYIRLNPITERDDTVAFSGRIYYPSPGITNILFDLELIWKVNGFSDYIPNSLKWPGTQKFVNIGAYNKAVASSNETTAGSLQWIELGNNQVALRLVDGPVLTVADNKTLYFNGTDIIESAIFDYIINDNSLFLRHGTDYVTVDSNGVLQANSSTAVSFDINDLDPVSEPIHLATYKEPFSFSGINVEEWYNSDIGIFYNENKNMTIGSTLMLEYMHLRNVTTSIWDMPAILASNDVVVNSTIESFDAKYDALQSLSNRIIPEALLNLSSNQVLPVTIVNDNYVKIIDLFDLPSSTSFSIDFSALGITISKMLKLNLYNTTSMQPLSLDDFSNEVITWDDDEDTAYHLLVATLKWFSVVDVVTVVDGIDVDLPHADISDILAVKNSVYVYIKSGLMFLQQIPRLFIKLRYFFDKITGAGATNALRIANAEVLASQATKAARCTSRLKGMSKAGVVIQVLTYAVMLGLTIWAGIQIAEAIGGSAGKEYGATWGIIAFLYDTVIGPQLTFYLSVLTGGVFAIFSLIDEFLGWIGSDNLGLGDLIKNFFINFIFGKQKRSVFMWPTAFISDIDVTFDDLDSNGLDVNDILNVICTLVGRISTNGTDVVGRLAESACWPSFFLSTSYEPPPGTLFASTPVTGIPEWYVPADTSSSDNPAWIQLEYMQSQSLVLNTAMPNLPVSIGLVSWYRMWNRWYHEWLDTFECYHNDEIVNILQSTQSGYDPYFTRLYFDVLPDSINDFVDWKGIVSNDFDGDELLNDDDGSRFIYDADSDGLNDKYEVITSKTDPANYDSDGDGLLDFYEVIYGTNATSADSDQDGLNDYIEVAGWVIDFDYMGNVSQPFSIRVTSDPTHINADGDDLDDLDEYNSNTNPRTNDTNGDAIADVSVPKIMSKAFYETNRDIETSGWIWDGKYENFAKPELMARVVDDIAVDKYGYVYTTSYSTSYYDGIKKFYANLTEVVLPDTSYFTPDDSWEIDGCVFDIEIDNENDWLYAWTYRWDWTLILLRFNLNGTILNPGSYTPISDAVTAFVDEPDLYASVPIYKSDLDFNSSGHIFTTNYQCVYDEGNLVVYGIPPTDIFDSSGSYLTSWGTWVSGSPGPEEFDNPVAIAVDSANGYVYIAEKAEPWHYDYTRVAKFRMSDGAYLTTLPDGFVSVEDIDVDSDGYVYVLGNVTEGPCLRKFDSNGLEQQDCAIFGNSTLNFTNPIAVTVDPDNNIFILDTVERGLPPSTSRIWKFSQIVGPESSFMEDSNTDWDGDGLTNAQELAGWEINVEFSSTDNRTFTVTSDPRLNDTDFDGLSDYQEYLLGSNPNCPDTDVDGTQDLEERWRQTHPGERYYRGLSPVFLENLSLDSTIGPNLTLWDSDNDLLADGREISFGSNPSMTDSDFDTLSDLIEFNINSDPNNVDTDDDGADDALEYSYGTSLLLQDSDGDFWFDGIEFQNGTDPLNFDSDGDGIRDGDEFVIGTSAQSADTDGDGVGDGLEVELWLDYLHADSDGDGIPDGQELELGSSPWSSDSDWDGIQDNEDPDTFAGFPGTIILAFDPSAEESSLAFIQELITYANVTIVSKSELMTTYSGEEYIILIGRPDQDSESICGLTYDLLKDSGTVLMDLMQPQSHEIAVRNGVWSNPQTIVMLSEPEVSDVYKVIQILRGRDVTLFPDSVLLSYNVPEVFHNWTYSNYFLIDGIDIMKTTDSVVGISLIETAAPVIRISSYNISTTPQSLTLQNGLSSNEFAIGRYLEVNVSVSGIQISRVQDALIKMYYKESDLDIDGNGFLGDAADINESTLFLYMYNQTSGQWVKLSDDLSWVLDCGVNTTDAEIYGERYAGYIWAQVTHLSLFGIAGQPYQIAFPIEVILVIVLIGVMIPGILFTYRRKFRRKPEESNHSKK